MQENSWSMLKTRSKSTKQNKEPGTRKESSLHHSLKFQYGEGGATEKLIDGYVCDAMTCKGEIIEVQTGSFGPLKEKVKRLTQIGKVRIIHPIIVQKHIELYDETGCLISKRKSPRKGNNWDVFKALLYAPELPMQKNLTIELAIIDVVEKRINDGKGSWRRKGASIKDRLLSAWRQTVILKKPKDYYQFLPFSDNERFTTQDLGERAGIKTALARKTLYVLVKMGIVEYIGKQGRAKVYIRSEQCKNSKKQKT